MAYAQAFGKHGSGDEDYDEYVHALQGEVTGLVVRRICDKERRVRDEDVDVEVEEDVVSPSFAERVRDGDKMDEGRNKGKKK